MTFEDFYRGADILLGIRAVGGIDALLKRPMREVVFMVETATKNQKTVRDLCGGGGRCPLLRG